MQGLSTQNYTAGISIITFVLVVTISMAYYQFIYIPAVNEKPIVAAEILHPPQTTQINILPGSSQPSQTKNFEPKQISVDLGMANKVIWKNTDSVPHSVTSDTNYNDPTFGKFNSISHTGLVLPGQIFNFTFTQAGEYPYHCEPHPWMTGKVSIQKGKF